MEATSTEPAMVVLGVVAAALAVTALVFAVLWALGRVRAARRVRAQAEGERRLLALELAGAEQASKLTLIRELHEVTVTDLGTLVGHAQGARFRAGADPEAAARSAATIEDAARAVLADVRRLLVVVDDAEAVGVPGVAAPAPRELFDVMSRSGLELRVQESGTPFTLKSGPQLVVDRILQEGLSNALRHGGPGTAVSVSYTWTADSLSLVIEDDGELARQRAAGQRAEPRTAEQPTSAQPTSAQPTSAQPTSAQPTSGQPAAQPHERAASHPAGRTAAPAAASTGASNAARRAGLSGGLDPEIAPGSGLARVRDRVAVYGGVFNAARVPGVGFRLSVAFPRIRYNNGIHSVSLDPVSNDPAGNNPVSNNPVSNNPVSSDLVSSDLAGGAPASSDPLGRDLAGRDLAGRDSLSGDQQPVSQQPEPANNPAASSPAATAGGDAAADGDSASR